ncbi:hypothetical protein [Aquabacterium sp. A08]|uniref:hypothetical protein n=1 Tax=Aquabacterium sp. A08 TaxID=2718532 RepID=UPI001423C4A7|nr:hypothetical protein [Aquabacterium sp. A08]NIC43707.1 hypothetical protein [Aquabacterium sp. A08]
MKRILLSSLALASTQLAWAAAEFQYYVFPVQSITGLSQSATAATGSGPKYGGMINEKYADLLFDAPVQQSLLNGFREEVRKRFPQAVVGANQIASVRSGKYAYLPYDNAQCNPSFTVNYKDAFAVAMGVSRFSAYINKFGDYVDALIPITYTLRFVKLNGADVAFSRSETIYTRYSTTAREFFAPNGQDIAPAVIDKLKSAIQIDGTAMTARLLDTAAKGFSPKQTEIGVTGRDGDFIVFSHGSEVGFASNQEFEAYDDKGRELAYTVVYATHGLAVAVASDYEGDIKRLSNGVRTGDNLSFRFTKQGQDDVKPTLFVSQYQPIADTKLTEYQVINNALTAIATDDIGFTAPFNIVKHDADFSRLKEQIRSEANCESTIYRTARGFADNTTIQRPQPDFYLKLDSFSSPAVTSWGTGRVNSNTVFSNAVTLSVMDRNGVITQSFLGNSPYTLVRNAGKGLSQEEAGEVNLKNAAMAGMQSMITRFNSTAKTVAIRSVSNGVATLAQPLHVNVLKQARLVRPLKANGKQIAMPLPGNVAQFVVPSENGDRIEVKGDVKPSDVLVISGTDVSQQGLARCDARRSRFLTENLNHPSNGDGAVAAYLLHRVKGYNLLEVDQAYLRSVERSLQEGFFSSTQVAPTVTPTSCYVVLEQQQITSNQCTGELCSGTAVVGSGIRIYTGETKVVESIHGARFEFKDIPPDALSPFVGVKAYENHMGALPIHSTKLN